MRLHRIAIGMDFSPNALAAASWVARHVAPDAELVLVHAIVVLEPPPPIRGRFPSNDALIETARVGAEQRMRELSRALGPRRTWSEIRVGPAAEQIAQVSREYHADLVVVGKHGERPGAWDRLGSTAERLIQTAAIPVLLVAGARDAPPRRLLVAVNDSAVAPWVVAWARELAVRFDAQTVALHVVGSTVSSGVLAEGQGPVPLVALGDVSAAMSNPAPEGSSTGAPPWLARLVGGGVGRHALATDVAFGDPGREIVAAAQRMDADLIVMGSRGSRGLARVLLGSVAAYVLRHAPCPTLVVREPEDELTDHH